LTSFSLEICFKGVILYSLTATVRPFVVSSQASSAVAAPVLRSAKFCEQVTSAALSCLLLPECCEKLKLLFILLFRAALISAHVVVPITVLPMVAPSSLFVADSVLLAVLCAASAPEVIEVGPDVYETGSCGFSFSFYASLLEEVKVGEASYSLDICSKFSAIFYKHFKLKIAY